MAAQYPAKLPTLYYKNSDITVWLNLLSGVDLKMLFTFSLFLFLLSWPQISNIIFQHFDLINAHIFHGYSSYIPLSWTLTCQVDILGYKKQLQVRRCAPLMGHFKSSGSSEKAILWQTKHGLTNLCKSCSLIPQKETGVIPQNHPL